MSQSINIIEKNGFLLTDRSREELIKAYFPDVDLTSKRQIGSGYVYDNVYVNTVSEEIAESYGSEFSNFEFEQIENGYLCIDCLFYENSKYINIISK